MPADRAAAIRCLVAFTAMLAGFLFAISTASHDLRQTVAIVRAAPPSQTPALASIEVRR